MFITHPRLASAYVLGSFGLVVSYLLVDEYKLNNTHLREMCVLDKNQEMLYTTHTHEKHMLDTKNTHEKHMLDTKNSHEKYMLENSRWWKQLI